MSVLTMDMSSYEIELRDVAAEGSRETELNEFRRMPLAALHTASPNRQELPPAMAFANVEEFLLRMRHAGY